MTGREDGDAMVSELSELGLQQLLLTEFWGTGDNFPFAVSASCLNTWEERNACITGNDESKLGRPRVQVTDQVLT